MRARFWGTRGSIATPGPGTVRFGGNTSCVAVTTDGGRCIVFDCGTGARPLGEELVAHAPKPLDLTILLSHVHWDHIQGFPFFAPLFVAGSHITVCGPEGSGGSLQELLAGQMEFKYFPVELGQLPASITFRELTEGAHELGGVTVIAQYLNHPASTLGYRIEADGAAVVYLCDHEPFSDSLWRKGEPEGNLGSIVHEGDQRHANFMKGAGLVIHDAQYAPEEYPLKKNWGHSTFEYVVELASAAGVGQVALTHHDPAHDDGFVAEIQARARRYAAQRRYSANILCAYEGLDLSVVRQGDQPSMTTPRTTPLHHDFSGTKRILVVDDDRDVLTLASAALSQDGNVVTTASGGAEALASIEADPPHLVVLDLLMPPPDGMEVLRVLRSRPATASLAVLVLTSMDDEASTLAGFEVGATDYLAKPFTVPQLRARVTACLARAEAAREADQVLS